MTIPPARRKTHGCLYAMLAGVGGVIVLIIIIAVVASGGGGGKPAATASPAASQAAKIGAAVRDGKFQFTLTSISQQKSVGDTANGLGDTAQGDYTILHVSVTNIGTASQNIDDSAQHVYDSSGKKYDASSAADIDLGGASGATSTWWENINPGNTVQGELAFDMPTGAKAVRAEFHDSTFSGGVTVALAG